MGAELLEDIELDKELSSRALSEFIQLAWPVLEPTTELRWGWAMGAICEHLEAVARGQLSRLLINCPPGFLKSLATTVFLPAWIWGPLGKPEHRVIGSSYSETYATRDCRRQRDLVSSEWYQERWGDLVELEREGERSFSNKRMGWRESIPFSRLTGGRADLLVCFPADVLVLTADGPRRIADLVDQRSEVKVLSEDTVTGRREYVPIIGWHRNPGAPLVEVGISDGGRITCTPDHRLWTRRGWVPAGELLSSDVFPQAPFADSTDGVCRDVELLSQRGWRERGGKYLSDVLLCQLRQGAHFASSDIGGFSFPFGDRLPGFSSADLLHCRSAYSEAGSEGVGSLVARGDQQSLFSGELRPGAFLQYREGPMSLGIRDVLRPGSVRKVLDAVVRRIPVEVANFLTRLWGSKKGEHKVLVDVVDDVLSGLENTETGISAFSCPAVQERALDFSFHTITHGGYSRFRAHSPERAYGVRAFQAGDRFPCFVRPVAHAEVTYCLSTAKYRTFYVGEQDSLLVHNCDDPHSTENVESPADLERARRIFSESVPTRLVDPAKSAIIVIMQRLHVADVSALAIEQGYTHLCLPMEHEPDRSCSTSLGFRDPRTEEDELLFPERFPAEVVERDKEILGTHAVAGQFQQRPSPRGGGILKEAWFANRFRQRGASPLATVLSVDCASKSKERNDPSAAGIWAAFPDHFELWHVDVGRREFPALMRWLKDLAAMWQPTTVLIEDKDAGQQAIQQLKADTKLPVIAFQPGKLDKLTRMDAEAPTIESGRVWLPAEAPWVSAYLAEVTTVPTAPHDDQFDMTSMFLRWYRTRKKLQGSLATPYSVTKSASRP